MLIEFSVSNFRSFRERQTLSMVAASRLRKKENTFRVNSPGEKLPALLKVAVIYGPNASGKSNLLKALSVIGQVAFREPNVSNLPLPVAPFAFDPDLADKSSEFEVHFVHQEMRYQFNFAATANRITREELLMYPRGREVLLYSRQHIETGDTYVFGPEFEGDLTLCETWKKLTPPRLLFISQAVANSSEELTQLKIPFQWLTRSTFSLLHGMSGFTNASQRLAEKDDIHSKDIASFLREVDVPISKIRVEKPEDTQDQPSGGLGIANQSSRRTYLTHKTALGEAELRFDDESEGTKNLIGFWLPWATKNPSDASDRRILVVDELDSSLHPKIVSILVAKHVESSIPSQLIFTTHDTHLMDSNLLRRDQIWITDRDMYGATQLRAIHDYEGREGEDIEKRYYEGRYRGLPLIRKASNG
jgi:hypothetical protein